MSEVQKGSKVIKGDNDLHSVICKIQRDYIWPNTAPDVINATVIICGDSQNNNNTNQNKYILTTTICFSESCPKPSKYPPIKLSLTDGQGNEFLNNNLFKGKKQKSDFFNAEIDLYRLSGNISVNYELGCVNFDAGSKLSYRDEEFPLDNIVVISWYRKKVSKLLESMPQISKYPQWYPNDISNTLKIDKLIIKTEGKSLNSENPQINVKVTSPEITISCKHEYELTPTNPSTKLISIKSGKEFPGIESKIIADFKKGCIYFDTDDHKAFLLKPEKEKSLVKHYPIKDVIIFDWFGKSKVLSAE